MSRLELNAWGHVAMTSETIPLLTKTNYKQKLRFGIMFIKASFNKSKGE